MTSAFIAPMKRTGIVASLKRNVEQLSIMDGFRSESVGYIFAMLFLV